MDTDMINRLVKESFGFLYFGNFDPIIDPLCGDQAKGPHPKIIARRMFYPVPLLWEYYKMVGKFLKEDGSSMVVDENYLPQAKKYALLYKEKTGIDVIINDRNSINN